MKRKTLEVAEIEPDVVDDIEKIALREIRELRVLADGPDARITGEVCGRIRALLEIVILARKEQREQLKWVDGLKPEQLRALGVTG